MPFSLPTEHLTTKGSERVFHQPVMIDETLNYLLWKDEGTYIDATIGGGGHTDKLIEASEHLHILGIDKDPDAISYLTEKFFGNDRVSIAEGNFAKIEEISRRYSDGNIYGVLMDLGVSSHQIESPERGFSYNKNGPLDMRMNKFGKSADAVVNHYTYEKLAEIFGKFGEARYSKHIAKAIVAQRSNKGPIKTTLELRNIIETTVPAYLHNKIIPQIFQAIRINVNEELKQLEEGLKGALNVLVSGGRLVAISYHSGEDRIVKHFFDTEAKDCICPPDIPVCRCGHTKRVRILTRKPITPCYDEIKRNPNARSAHFRAAEKL